MTILGAEIETLLELSAKSDLFTCCTLSMSLMSFAFASPTGAFRRTMAVQRSLYDPSSSLTRSHSFFASLWPHKSAQTVSQFRSCTPHFTSHNDPILLSMVTASRMCSKQSWKWGDTRKGRGANRPKADSSSVMHGIDDDGGKGFGDSCGGGGDGDGDGENRRDPNNNGRSGGLLGAYFRLLERRALQTKVVTSAILTLLSDVIAQTFEQGGKPVYDWRRSWALFMVGGVLTAPMFHVLYGLLESALPIGAGWGNLVLQLAVDQLVAAPVWLAAFFGLVALFEGRFEMDRVIRQMERDFVPTMKLTWTIFPPVQLASFALLKPNLRVLTLNVVDLGYTTALSYIKHRPQKSDEGVGYSQETKGR